MTGRSQAILRSVADRQAKLSGCATAGGCPSIWNVAYKLDGSGDKLNLADGAATYVGAEEKQASATFVISTNVQDRDGDVVVPRGCRLDHFKLNPVVFFNHQQNPMPIGRAMDPAGRLAVSVEESRIVSTVYFDQGCADAMYLYGKVVRGFLRATSIGFLPLEAERLDQKGGGTFAGWLFKLWELLEWSLVGVPSNPLATLLSDLKSAKISDSLRKSLEPLAPPLTPWANGSEEFLPAEEATAADGIELIEDWSRERQGKALPLNWAQLTWVQIKSAILADNPSSDKRCLLFAKKKYPAAADATSWLAAYGYEEFGHCSETDLEWVFEFFPADACQAGSEREEEMADGVRAYVCQRKIEEDKPEVRNMSDQAKEGCKCGGSCEKCKVAKAAAAEVPEETAGGENTEARSMPHGASMACSFHKLCKENADAMEPNSPMRKWMAKAHGDMCKLVGKHYAHLDLDVEPMDFSVGDEATENKDEGDEDAGDAEAERDDDGTDATETEEPAEGMQDQDGDGDGDDDEDEAKRVAVLTLLAKRMSVKQKARIKEAAEHLEGAAEHSETPKMHKVAHKYHAEQLYKVLEGTDRATTEGELEDEGRRSYEAAKARAAEEEEWLEVRKQMAEFQRDLQSANARIAA